MLAVLYLVAITAANLLVAAVGPPVAIFTAFAFVGLNFALRNQLDEQWGKDAPRNLLILAFVSMPIVTLIYVGAFQVALASLLALIANIIIGTALYRVSVRPRFKLVLSNIGMSISDSFVFALVAFGFPFLWHIVGAQIIAKLGGSIFWHLVLKRIVR